MSNKAENDQDTSELCSFILIKFSYNNQYILPIEDAINMIRSLAKSRQYVDDYGKPTKVKNKVDEISIGFISEMDIKTLAVQAALQPKT